MLSSRQKITTIEVTPTSRLISLGTKPGELCGNPKLNPNTMCLKLSAHFQNDCHSSLFHAPKPRWIKNTHQATCALCVSSKALPQWRWNLQAKCSEWFTLPWRQWWIFQLPALSFSCVPALSALSENSPKPHSSHRFKLFPPPDSLHLFFSPPPPFLPTVPLPPMLPVVCLPRLCFVTSCFPSTLLRPHTQSWPLVFLPFLLCVGLFCECVSRKARRLFFFGWVGEWGVGLGEGVECSFAF